MIVVFENEARVKLLEVKINANEIVWVNKRTERMVKIIRSFFIFTAGLNFLFL